MTKVKFLSPGTFVSESDFIEVEGLTLKTKLKNAVKASKTIKQRHGAKPYCFFLNGIQYFLPHCKVRNVDDITNNEKNKILISNCRNNDWKYIVETTEGWLSTHPFDKKCALLNENGEVVISV